MASLDTSVAVAALHEDSYRQLGLAGRFKIALELSDFTHALAVAGLKCRCPELSDEDARRRLAEVLYASGDSRRE